MSRRGFTLTETVLSTLFVAVLLTAALHTVGAARTAGYRDAGRSRGHLLAAELLAEIMQQPYADPDGGPIAIGLDDAETSRTAFDDVDDYHGWSASPPKQRDGTVMSDLPGWTREVEVRWIDASNTDVALAAETGAKRVTVSVSHNGVPMARLVAVRSSVFPRIDR